MSRSLIVLLFFASLTPSFAQSSRALAKAQAAAQSEWYERSFERPDLVPGAWEVARFPTGYHFKARYRHDPKDKKRILNPDFYCTRCVREGRIAASGSREDVRLCQRSEAEALAWIERSLRIKKYSYIEDESFKLFMELPGFNTKKFRNPFRVAEMEELHDIFPKVSKKTVVLNDHQRAHLYLIRAHRLLRDWWWLVGSNPSSFGTSYPPLKGNLLGMKNKQEVFVFRRRRSYATFLEWAIGAKTVAEGCCWHHLSDRAMLMAMHGQGAVEPAVQNFFLHRMMHNYVDAYRVYSFKLPAWLQMGLGHWVERRESAAYNSFCFSEGTLPRVLNTSKWLPKIQKLVAKGKVKPFVEIANFTEYGDFPPSYHMVNYSLVCFLISLGPKKFRVFINEMKSKKVNESLHAAQVRAFRSAYKMTLLRFDQRWRAWVAAVYPSV